MLSLMEKFKDLKVGLENDKYVDVILQSLPPSFDPFIVNFNMNGLEKSINELMNTLVQYEATIKKYAPSVLIGEASTSKAKGKRAGRWKERRVLQRSRKLSKDEVVLRFGDGKAVASEVVGIINLVVSDRVRLELKDCYFVPSMIKNIISIPLLDNAGFEFFIKKNCFYLMKDGSSHLLGKLNKGLHILQRSDWIMIAKSKHKLENLENAQIWHARLGHISQDRMKRLVDSKSLEIDDLDNLPACESYLKGKMTRKPFVGQSKLANGLLDLIHTMSMDH
ncbi:hypothetical protein Sango_3106500 [Sesamum angolense]|uniref:GAG-pre-integrase domain-containing protein n=1 Tax=Sesamum angolense TaxID=2727404 RepID=A0AAE1T837_9LAMI|nr:hypothetical protein Sango_3106500 [Sesamum angolense]